MIVKDIKLLDILEKCLNGYSLTKEDCIYLLCFNENSMEASLIKDTANYLVRKKSENSAIIVGQIGIDVSECTGGCKFCTFGEGHIKFKPKKLSDAELIEKINSFNDKDDLYGLFLMTMHDYDPNMLLNAIKLAKSNIKPHTQIWINIGDTKGEALKEFKKAGVTGIYHVCRLNEGVDTKLEPKNRIKTMECAIEAGLSLYTCLEPIGPEHTNQQLVDNMFIGIDLNCTWHAAMRRVAVKNTPLAKYGQITELRLSQIVAVVALASYYKSNMTYCGVHEPNQMAYIAGANIITAESGANPRDMSEETSKNRGFNMNVCRKMMYDCGFSDLKRGDESKISLSLDYLG